MSSRAHLSVAALWLFPRCLLHDEEDAEIEAYVVGKFSESSKAAAIFGAVVAFPAEIMSFLN